MQRFGFLFVYYMQIRLKKLKCLTKELKIKNVMKKLFVIPFLFILLFGAVSCLDDSEPIFYFSDEPAMVENLGATPIIKTPHGKFIVPGLAEEALNEGNLLWTSFYVDMNKQANEDSLVVAGFRYTNVNKEKVELPEDVEVFNEFLKDDYSAPFQSAELYSLYIDHYLFFGFYHHNTTQKYSYEIIGNPEIEGSGEYPTLYIRAKKDSVSEDSSTADKKGRIIAAFDMAKFLDKYGKEIGEGKKSVKFNLKYKVGTDTDGKDIYREFLSNPISWSAR